MDRIKIIDSLISTFEKLPDSGTDYAIRVNIQFLKSIKKITSYLKWLFLEAPKLNRSALKEMTDFDVPEWSNTMHIELMLMERKNFPGLIKPLVKKLTDLINTDPTDKIICNIGCGGMEAERQIIKKLIDNKNKMGLVFLGIDLSDDAIQLAQDNLKDLSKSVDFVALSKWNYQKFQYVLEQRNKDKILVVACKDNFLNVTNLPVGYFNILFHTLFRHHLDTKQQKTLDQFCFSISRKIVEYDGFKSWINMFPQSLIGWGKPIFLNAEIFSNLRFKNKREINQMYPTQQILFYRVGYYMVELQS